MKNIPHKKIRALLQAAADQALPPEERMVLDTHLAECGECSAYAQNLVQLQDGLRRVMQQQWNVRSKPLPIEAIKNRANRIAAQNQVAGAVRKFAFVPMLAIVFFMALSFKVINPQQAAPGMGIASSNTPDISLLVPRPPVGLTATKLLTQDCGRATYVVQENDTLDEVAAKYGVSTDTIIAYNGLASDKIDPQSILTIPFCERTSVEATTTPTVPNTIAPAIGPVDPSPRG
ncbi:MAG: LysM peptidoglycan-binding domain-containing protein [Anaerolineales bacterium]